MPRPKKDPKAVAKPRRRLKSSVHLPEKRPPVEEDINREEDPSGLPESDDGGEVMAPAPVPEHGLTPKGTPYVSDNRVDGSTPDDEKARDFNEWMRRIKKHLEQDPDQYMFRIMRTYPRMSPDNQIMTGPVMTVFTPFCEEWMGYVFSDGGRFNVQYIGPKGTIVRMFANVSIPKRFMSEGTKAELVKLTPFFDDIPSVTKNIEDRIVQREGKSTSAFAPEGSTANMKIRSRSEDDESEGEEEEEDEDDRRARRYRQIPPIPYAPPPPIRDPGQDMFARFAERATEQNARQLELAQERADRSQAELMKSLAGANSKGGGMQEEMMLKMVSTLTEGIIHRSSTPPVNEDTRREVERLHGVVSEMTKANAQEIIRITNDYKTEMTSRLNEVRDNNDRTLREITERHASALRETNDRYQDKISDTSRSRDDHEKMIREQLTEAKLLLSAKESEVNRLNTEVMRLSGECTLAKAELQSRSAAHEMEVKSAVLEAKFAGKKTDEDPISTFVNKIKQAKELSESLGEQLGSSSKSDKTDEKKSRIDGIVEVAKALGGSKEFRSLASTVVEGAGKAAAAVIKARGEAKAAQSTSAAASASVADIMAAHRRQRAVAEGALANPAPIRHIAQGVTAPSAATLEPEPTSVIDSVIEAADDIERIRQIAEELLDQIEEFAALETPLREASEYMIEKLIEASGGSEDEIFAMLDGTSAEKTLKELELPANRLSSGALDYMDKVIAYTIESSKPIQA